MSDGKGEQLEKSKQAFRTAISLEKRSGMIRYSWALALQGLTEACLKQVSYDDDIRCIKDYIRELLEMLDGKEDWFIHEYTLTKSLLQQINSHTK